MKYLVIFIVAGIYLYGKIINSQDSSGIYTANEMTVINLYAKSDGYAQIDKTPHTCGTVHLLDSKGKNLGSLNKGYENMNKAIQKGQLKIMITPEEKCKISFSIPD